MAITGFGSVWRYRLGKPNRGARLYQPVYYNTTGVVVHDELRQRPQICGYARFDAVGGFDPNRLPRMINRVFECAEPGVWMGFNKLLFKRIVRPSRRPDCYLVIARSGAIGRLHLGQESWRSPDSWTISFTEGAGQQEAMILLTTCGWIQTDLGKFTLKTPEQRPWEGRLALCVND